MLDQLRQRMAAYPYNDLPVKLPEAAVLMPFVDQPEPELILTVRAQGLSTHAGQVAFPGGKRDPEDPDLKTTALRESHEEVGLPHHLVEVVGQLSPIPSRFGIKVTPFVGLVRPGFSLVPEPGEIDTIFHVPLNFSWISRRSCPRRWNTTAGACACPATSSRASASGASPPS